MPPQPRIAEIFRPLAGSNYESYRDLEQAVNDRLSAERPLFPASYTYRDAIVWASEAGLIAVDQSGLSVRDVEPSAEVAEPAEAGSHEVA